MQGFRECSEYDDCKNTNMAFKHWEYYSIICCIFIFLQAHKIYTYKKKLSVHKLNKVMVMQSLLH